MNIEQEIIRILEEYTVDNIGETRPYIDPDLKQEIAADIVKKCILGGVGKRIFIVYRNDITSESFNPIEKVFTDKAKMIKWIEKQPNHNELYYDEWQEG